MVTLSDETIEQIIRVSEKVKRPAWEKPFWSISEAAKYLDLCENSVREAVRTGQIPHNVISQRPKGNYENIGRPPRLENFILPSTYDRVHTRACVSDAYDPNGPCITVKAGKRS